MKGGAGHEGHTRLCNGTNRENTEDMMEINVTSLTKQLKVMTIKTSKEIMNKYGVNHFELRSTNDDYE